MRKVLIIAGLGFSLGMSISVPVAFAQSSETPPVSDQDVTDKMEHRIRFTDPAPEPSKVTRQWGVYAQLAGSVWSSPDKGAEIFRWKQYGRELEVISYQKANILVERIVPDKAGRKLIDTVTIADKSGVLAVYNGLVTASKTSAVMSYLSSGQTINDQISLSDSSLVDSASPASAPQAPSDGTTWTLSDMASADQLLHKMGSLPDDKSLESNLPFYAIIGPDPRDIARQWGMLAQLDGRIWNLDGDSLISFGWRQPGEEMTVVEQSIFDSTETRITKDPVSGALHYVALSLESGERSQGVIAIGKTEQSYDQLPDTGAVRLTWSLANNALTTTSYSGQKFDILNRIQKYTPTDTSTADIFFFLRERYPVRSADGYDPRLGILGLMSGGDWVQEDYKFPTDKSLQECCRQPARFAIVGNGASQRFAYAPPSTFGMGSDVNPTLMFDRFDGKVFHATRLTTSREQPEGSSDAQLQVLPGGTTIVSIPGQYTAWHLSDDGEEALAITYRYGENGWEELVRSIYDLDTPIKPASLVDQLSGVIFRHGNGYFEITGNNKSFAINDYINGRGEVSYGDTTTCYVPKDANQLTCSRSRYNDDGTSTTTNVGFDYPGKDVFAAIRADGVTYQLNADGNLVKTDRTGASEVLTRISLIQYAFDTGMKRYEKAVNEHYEDQARAEAAERQRKADNAAFWGAVAGAALKGAIQLSNGDYGNAYTAPQTNWGSAGSVVLQGNKVISTRGVSTNGSVGDMGGSFYVPVPAGHDSISQAEKDDILANIAATRAQQTGPLANDGRQSDARTDPTNKSVDPQADSASGTKMNDAVSETRVSLSRSGTSSVDTGAEAVSDSASAAADTATSAKARASASTQTSAQGDFSLVVGPDPDAERNAQLQKAAEEQRQADAARQAVIDAQRQAILDKDAADAKAAADKVKALLESEQQNPTIGSTKSTSASSR